jgi:hypothetical protein
MKKEFFLMLKLHVGEWQEKIPVFLPKQAFLSHSGTMNRVFAGFLTR